MCSLCLNVTIFNNIYLSVYVAVAIYNEKPFVFRHSLVLQVMFATLAEIINYFQHCTDTF